MVLSGRLQNWVLQSINMPRGGDQSNTVTKNQIPEETLSKCNYLPILLRDPISLPTSRSIESHFHLSVQLVKYVCMYLSNRSSCTGCDTRSIFQTEFVTCKFSFPYPTPVAKTKLKKEESVLVFTHNWRENTWIHTIPKFKEPCLGFEIGPRVHFFRRYHDTTSISISMYVNSKKYKSLRGPTYF